MPNNSPTQPILLSSSSPSSPCSYELQGSLLIARLFGLIPVFSIHLSNVHYLRLATRDEVRPIYLINWVQFLPHRQSICPVYIVKAKTGRRLFLKLDSSAHFKLRQAIGQQQHEQVSHRIAA